MHSEEHAAACGARCSIHGKYSYMVHREIKTKATNCVLTLARIALEWKAPRSNSTWQRERSDRRSAPAVDMMIQFCRFGLGSRSNK